MRVWKPLGTVHHQCALFRSTPAASSSTPLDQGYLSTLPYASLDSSVPTAYLHCRPHSSFLLALFSPVFKQLSGHYLLTTIITNIRDCKPRRSAILSAVSKLALSHPKPRFYHRNNTSSYRTTSFHLHQFDEITIDSTTFIAAGTMDASCTAACMQTRCPLKIAGAEPVDGAPLSSGCIHDWQGLKRRR